ncbi:hypothetical protein SERLADRAFT_480728 [Serpula lacrymans var. lacrymans S7.9]|uniref:Uncharacterized protein n=1 Tax=Serpula lacrymans var. lacrymans (strain S7.9) TaxID=578457 RepID=F8PDZ8_SERL9|nr:uncharacterized protein SERLADRAFT_480728 [Serpula lacrymans var. lacrymans S7.9]EGO18595.1 hypothetical protein SERLADRAFT_480728 [Serpula lacrymans var. lacrymans S7.9]
MTIHSYCPNLFGRHLEIRRTAHVMPTVPYTGLLPLFVIPLGPFEPERSPRLAERYRARS